MAVFVELVGRAGAVVDQVDDVVEAPGLLRADEELGERGGRADSRAGHVAGLLDDRVGGAEGRARRFGGVAEGLEGDGGRRGERAQVAGRFGQRRGRLVEVGEDRRGRIGEAFEVVHRGPELAQELGELAEARFQFGAAFGGRLAGGAGVGEEPGDVLALFGERAGHALGVGGELGQFVALLVEDFEQAVGVAKIGVGALDRRRDVRSPPGQGGAEFVEDQPEALRVGQRVDVVDQVGVDAGAVVLDRQQPLARARLAFGDLFQRWRRLAARRPWQGRPAIEVLLADQRLRADQAGGVFAEVLEARVFDVHHDHGLARDRFGLAVFVAVDLTREADPDRFDFADVGAGDADLLALDHEGAVVEEAAHDVAVVAAVRGRDQHDRDDDGDEQEGDQPFFEAAFFHGASAGLHCAEVTPEPVNGGST